MCEIQPCGFSKAWLWKDWLEYIGSIYPPGCFFSSPPGWHEPFCRRPGVPVTKHLLIRSKEQIQLVSALFHGPFTMMQGLLDFWQIKSMFLNSNDLYFWRSFPIKTRPKLQSKQGSWLGSRFIKILEKHVQNTEKHLTGCLLPCSHGLSYSYMHSPTKVYLLTKDVWIILSTRWAPTSYKWSWKPIRPFYKGYNSIYNWFLGPPCILSIITIVAHCYGEWALDCHEKTAHPITPEILVALHPYYHPRQGFPQLFRLSKMLETKRKKNLPKTNIGPKNWWSPIGISFSWGLFSGATSMLVSGRVLDRVAYDELEKLHILPKFWFYWWCIHDKQIKKKNRHLRTNPRRPSQDLDIVEGGWTRSQKRYSPKWWWWMMVMIYHGRKLNNHQLNKSQFLYTLAKKESAFCVSIFPPVFCTKKHFWANKQRLGYILQIKKGSIFLAPFEICYFFCRLYTWNLQ